MSTTTRTLDIQTPWPYCWAHISWEIAAWIARHGERAHVQLIWNESRLDAQVQAQDFIHETKPFHDEAKKLLDTHLDWQYQQAASEQGHQLCLTLRG
jgi:hypothetical protein